MDRRQLLISGMCLLLTAYVNADIPPVYHHIAAANNVPAEMLYAISLNESGKKLVSENFKPWPWTLNVAGKSYFYPTRQEACFALQNFVKRYSLKNIDVGLAQVNIGHNGRKFFARHCDGFEPGDNLRAASVILSNCYKVHKNWVNAAGCYHRPAGGLPAKRYKRNILKKLIFIRQNVIQKSPDDQQIPESAVTQISLPQPSQTGKTIRHIRTTDKPVTKKQEQGDRLIWLEPEQQQIVWLDSE